MYLSSAGKNEAEVKAKALELIRQVRAGADFGALAAVNSERELNGARTGPQTKGKVGSFEVPSLREDIATAIKGIAVGGVSEPIRSNDGYQILRVDERTPGSDAAAFNENQVREAITMERTPKERDAFLKKLRDDAYIKISENYRASVAPLLNLPPEKTADNSATERKPAEKKKGKLLGIFPKP
jgi:peptidyl-prolyl cis-trans isomerase SurA